MFLRATTRKKDGKTHRYWSVVENRRLADGRVVQRHVLYLGEINDSQAQAWRRSIEVLDEREDAPRTVALFPEDRIDELTSDASVVRLRLSPLRLCQPRVWGSCWLALKLWERLELDRFWSRRLSRLEKELLLKPWQEARPGVQVKLLPQHGETYIFAQGHDRIAKERTIRKRQLKRLWACLAKLSTMKLSRESLLMKRGAAQNQSPSAWRLVEVKVDDNSASFRYALRRDKLREMRRREGRYLLRTDLSSTDPAELWRYNIQLVQVEQAFKDLKGDLALRPIYHQLEPRIDAHIFIAFLAYCLHVTLAQQLRPHAGGLTPRSVLEKFAAVQMLDVHIPTSDDRELVLTRYTEPEKELKLLLERLALELPAQPPPKITAAQADTATSW